MIKPLIFSLFVGFSTIIGQVNSISCYDCRADDSTCDVGECHGVACVKMETANLDNERRTVHKSCSDEYEETQCKQSTFGSKMIMRCTCNVGAFCNGEDALVAAGLVSSNTQKLITNPIFTIISVILILFNAF